MKKKISYYESKRDIINEIAVLEMENVKADPHFHRCIEMLFIKKGEAEICAGTLKRTFRQGEIAFIGLYVVHSAFAVNSNSDTLLIPEKYFAAAATNCNLNYFALDDVEYNKKLFEIEEEIKKRYTAAPQFMLEGLVSVLLGYINEKYTPCEPMPAETQLMSSIVDWIDKNFMQNISLETAAAHFGFSKYYFSRLFNKLFGCNFTVYLNRVRARYVYDNYGKGKTVTSLIYEAGFGCTSSYYQFIRREQN